MEGDHNAVDQREQWLREVDLQQRLWRREFVNVSALKEPIEALLTKFEQASLQRFGLCGDFLLLSLSRFTFTLLILLDRNRMGVNRAEHIHTRAFAEIHDCRRDFIDRVALHFLAALRAVCAPNTRE